MPTQGMFELKTAQDLKLKARHDLGRLRSNRIDAYAAFDFFVTVRHIPDWLFPNERKERARLFEKHVELRICRHLADGAKHFEATHSQHRQVKNTAESAGSWGGSWDRWGGSWGRGLFISLDPTDPDTKLIGDRVSVIALAEKALAIIEEMLHDNESD